MTARRQAARQRRCARGDVLGTDRLAVADHACWTAFAEIDDEARTAILLPLDIQTWMASGVIRRKQMKKGACRMSAENPLAVITGKNRRLISRRKSVVRPMSRHRLGDGAKEIGGERHVTE